MAKWLHGTAAKLPDLSSHPGWDPHCGRRELTPISCLLPSMRAQHTNERTNTRTHTHTLSLIFKISEKNHKSFIIFLWSWVGKKQGWRHSYAGGVHADTWNAAWHILSFNHPASNSQTTGVHHHPHKPGRHMTNKPIDLYLQPQTLAFFLLWFTFIIFNYMCVCVSVCGSLWRPKEGGMGVLWSSSYRQLWAALLECWKPNPGLLQEQQGSYCWAFSPPLNNVILL